MLLYGIQDRWSNYNDGSAIRAIPRTAAAWSIAAKCAGSNPFPSMTTRPIRTASAAARSLSPKARKVSCVELENRRTLRTKSVFDLRQPAVVQHKLPLSSGRPADVQSQAVISPKVRHQWHVVAGQFVHVIVDFKVRPGPSRGVLCRNCSGWRNAPAS